jgi:hypothetical protein
MEMGKYWILLMLMLTTGGKRVVKRPTTLAHFSTRCRILNYNNIFTGAGFPKSTGNNRI